MIEIINRFTGKAILAVETLRDANLQGANLQDADLQDANLQGANLRGAVLQDANLGGAILQDANLQGANLQGTCLWGALGNREEVKSIHIFQEYDVAYTATHLQIGCENHTIGKWWGFSNDEISDMDGDTALVFWQRNKQLIKQIIETNPAKPIGAESNEGK